MAAVGFVPVTVSVRSGTPARKGGGANRRR